MLIVISDLHFADGTCAKPISSAAFAQFADRLNELAYNASWRKGDVYQPIECIDILLLGDVFDPQHSTQWLDKALSDPDHVRPWTDFSQPRYAEKLQQITRAIIENNAASLEILRGLSRRGIRIPPATRRHQPAKIALHRAVVPVRIHYMVGNHDWYYHIQGSAFDEIRREIISAIGLSNLIQTFPHELGESAFLTKLMAKYRVYPRHGDIYDSYNYSSTLGRDAAALGDVFSVQVLNRFHVEVERRMRDDLPPGIVENLRELVNVRPALATPLWISGQLRQNNVPPKDQEKIKRVWDELAEEFIELDYVRQFDKRFKLDIVDGLNAIVKLTRRASFQTIDDIVVWVRKKMWSGNISFAHNALKEQAFIHRKAEYIVYGHTHQYEIVPLDMFPATPHPTNQLYMNSGTWHTYHDLAVYKPKEQKFIPYQVLTYLAFYKDGERSGRNFETWSSAFSD